MISQSQTSSKQRDATGDQLLAEEKWIVETLKKIRNQRNCLQIERLHLESLKCKLSNKTESISEVDITMDEFKEPAVSSNKQSQPVLTLDEEILCNEEELNLSVMSPMFDIKQTSTINMEEEEDDDEDEFNCDDLPIDMNMFMNGRKGT